MGFIGGFFIAAAVIIIFIAAVVGVICKLVNREPLFGDDDGRNKITKNILIAFAVIGFFPAMTFISSAIWALRRLFGIG